MIPAIPVDATFDDPPAGPSCCPDLFGYAEDLLAWIWTGTEDSPGIAECIGSDTTECGAMVRYVSWGPPIIRPFVARNLLAVYLGSPAVAQEQRRRNDNQMVSVQVVNYGIELWEGCYPVPGDDGNGPTYAQWHFANRHAYAHGARLYQRLLEGMGAFFSQVFTDCKTQTLAPLVPIDPGEPGIMVGWRTGLSVRW